MAIFLANESLELVWVKSVFPPCLLCVSLCLSESLGEKGLLSREWPVQALEMGNPKTNTLAKLLPSGLGFASPFGGEVSAFLGQAALTQHMWQARTDEWVPGVPESKMSSDGTWHLLYYSLSDSISLSCCIQPGGFSSRWLIQEITFPTLPIQSFHSSEVVMPSLSARLFPLPAQGNTGSLELTSLPVPAGGLPRADM